jgi:hypothetical protein
MANRGVLGVPFAGLDRPNNDLPSINPSSYLERRSPLATQAFAQASDLFLKPQRGVERALRMILMGNRCPKQGKNTIAGGLNDVAVVATHRIDHQLENRVDDGARFLGIQILLKAGGVYDVDEERRDEFALAFGHKIQFSRIAYSNS